MDWVSVGIIVVQIMIALVSYLTIYRHRSIFGIKTVCLRIPTGTSADVNAFDTTQINRELQDGKYTILQIVERHSDKDLEIIMGQIKK